MRSVEIRLCFFKLIFFLLYAKNCFKVKTVFFIYRLEKVVRKSDSLKNTRVQIEGEIKNNEVSTNDINATKKELLNSKKAKEEIFVKANRCKEKIKHLTNSLVGKNRVYNVFLFKNYLLICFYIVFRYNKRTC